jgi:hypothetical protein
MGVDTAALRMLDAVQQTGKFHAEAGQRVFNARQ